MYTAAAINFVVTNWGRYTV